MELAKAQQDMNYAYHGGATGVLASGLIWAIAASVAIYSSQWESMLALFFGGMLIHPLSMLFSKLLKRPAKHHSKNPLAKLAIESLGLLFIGLFLAFTVAKLQADLFYPIMLLTIGGRYLVFSTLYGLSIYWVLGLVLIAIGALCILFNASFITGVIAGSFVEVLFAIIIYFRTKKLLPVIDV